MVWSRAGLVICLLFPFCNSFGDEVEIEFADTQEYLDEDTRAATESFINIIKTPRCKAMLPKCLKKPSNVKTSKKYNSVGGVWCPDPEMKLPGLRRRQKRQLSLDQLLTGEDRAPTGSQNPVELEQERDINGNGLYTSEGDDSSFDTDTADYLMDGRRIKLQSCFQNTDCEDQGKVCCPLHALQGFYCQPPHVVIMPNRNGIIVSPASNV